MQKKYTKDVPFGVYRYHETVSMHYMAELLKVDPSLRHRSSELASFFDDAKGGWQMDKLVEKLEKYIEIGFEEIEKRASACRTSKNHGALDEIGSKLPGFTRFHGLQR